MAEGILSQVFKNTPLQGMGITPQLADKDLVIEMTEHQLKELIFKGLDDRARNSVDIKLTDGKMKVIIKIF